MGKWSKERDTAMRDGSVSGDFTQEQLELSDHDIGGVHMKESYETENTPIDPFTDPVKRDIRDVDKRGPK